MAVITKTLKSSGGDYTDLGTWEAGEQTNLVAAGNTHVLDCYIAAGGYTNSSTVTIGGWTTGASNYITIKAAAGNAHDGTTLSGIYFNNPGFVQIAVEQAYTRIIDIEVDGGASTSASGLNLKASNLLVDRCILGRFPGSGRFAIIFDSSGTNCTVRNSLIHASYHSVTTVSFAPVYTDESDAFKVINCSVVNISSGGTAFLVGTGGSGTRGYYVINCLTDVGSDTGYVSGGTRIQTRYCASSDASLGNTTEGSGNRDSQTFTFAGAGDYHLASGDAGAKDYGQDLSAYSYGSFSADVDGDTRTGSWDIGFDEYVAAGGGFQAAWARNSNQVIQSGGQMT